MTLAKLFRLVWQSINRNRRDFIFSSIGIVIGIGTLLFFTALGAGIKHTILERVFVIRQLEIEKKSYDVGLFKTSGGLFDRKLNDETVKTLQALPGVKSVYPKMKLTFPSGVFGGDKLIGKNLRAEFIADGIPESLVEPGEVKGPLAFKDWEAPISCAQDKSACPGGFTCGDGGTCQALSCDPAQQPQTTCTGTSYCHAKERVCMQPIPVLASPQMLEVYNGSIHTAMSGAAGPLSKLPQLGQDALIGFEGEAVLGRSFFIGASSAGEAVQRRIRLVGFSPKAINLGATMPIGYVQRYNAMFSNNKDAGKEYHSIIVETESNEAIATVAQAVTDKMGLALSEKYKNAERASLLILLITLIFNLISLIILAVAAVNIMHTFLMIILERKRELGLMRALGATRAFIRAMILCEASILGIFGGTLGALLGFGATQLVDAIFRRQVQDFPFKPDSLFGFAPWMFGLAVLAAVLFCWFGALLPAIRASRIDPAQALTGQ